MIDLAEDFKDFVLNLGIPVKETSTALLLGLCPSCGSSSFKVSFTYASIEDRNVMLGQCFSGSCGTGFSSRSYLRMLDVAANEIDALHGVDPNDAIRRLDANYQDRHDRAPPTPEEIERADVTEYVSSLTEISAVSGTSVAQYAIKRGVKPEHYPLVKLDLNYPAVVFLVKSGEEVIGYQRRYLEPLWGFLKTQTSKGFKKSENVICYPRPYSDIAICEGPFSAIAATSFGYSAVCTFGAGISQVQLDLVYSMLKTKGMKRVFLAFDLDSAGDKGTDRMFKYFAVKGIEVWKLTPEVGTDLNDALVAGKGITKEKINENPYMPSITI